jgi:hypothetical protein
MTRVKAKTGRQSTMHINLVLEVWVCAEAIVRWDVHHVPAQAKTYSPKSLDLALLPCIPEQDQDTGSRNVLLFSFGGFEGY